MKKNEEFYQLAREQSTLPDRKQKDVVVMGGKLSGKRLGIGEWRADILLPNENIEINIFFGVMLDRNGDEVVALGESPEHSGVLSDEKLNTLRFRIAW